MKTLEFTQAKLAYYNYSEADITKFGEVRAFNSMNEVVEALGSKAINADTYTTFEDGSILIRYELMKSRLEILHNSHNSTIDKLNQIQAKLRREFPNFVRGAL